MATWQHYFPELWQFIYNSICHLLIYLPIFGIGQKWCIKLLKVAMIQYYTNVPAQYLEEISHTMLKLPVQERAIRTRNFS